MQIHTHLFLVHEDMIPNITPAIDPAFRPKKVFLLCSPNANDQTERLEIILKESGIVVSRWPLNELMFCGNRRRSGSPERASPLR